MKAFEDPCFSGNMFNLMFFHPCIITMITIKNYFSFPELNLLLKVIITTQGHGCFNWHISSHLVISSGLVVGYTTFHEMKTEDYVTFHRLASCHRVFTK